MKNLSQKIIKYVMKSKKEKYIVFLAWFTFWQLYLL